MFNRKFVLDTILNIIGLLVLTFIIIDIYQYHTQKAPIDQIQQVIFYNRFTQPYTQLRIFICDPSHTVEVPNEDFTQILTILITDCDQGQRSYRTILDSRPISDE